MIKIICSIFLLVGLAFAANPTNPLNNSSSQNKLEIKDKKYSEILSYLEQKGDGENLFYLASFYLNGSEEKDSDGKTVQKNPDLAERWFKESVEKKFPFAAITLGSLYLYHEDFIVKENNIELAEKYLKISIEEGIFEAYTPLADIYFNFKGDAKKSLDYLSKGASKKIATSQYALAVIYNTGLKAEGFVLEKNAGISAKFLTDACTNSKRTKQINTNCYDKTAVSKIKTTK